MARLRNRAVDVLVWTTWVPNVFVAAGFSIAIVIIGIIASWVAAVGVAAATLTLLATQAAGRRWAHLAAVAVTGFAGAAFGIAASAGPSNGLPIEVYGLLHYVALGLYVLFIIASIALVTHTRGGAS